MAEERHYYLVAPLAGTGKEHDRFTYHGPQAVAAGSLVKIPLGKKSTHGVVLETSPRPDFKTKPLEISIELPPLPPPLLETAQWLSEYYAAPLPAVFQTMLPVRPQVVTQPSQQPQYPKAGKIALNTAQKQAVRQISEAKTRACLLHGATGSGKTHIYIELARQALAEGKSSLILVPEISLTPQIAERFRTVFAERVIITHSGLKATARRSLWQKALRAKEPLVVIGPRSALFTPLRNLGLIVIDEAHETSYKQDQTPRYHAVMAAAKLSTAANARLLLGSATPGSNEIFLAKAGRLELIELPEPVHTIKRIEPQIVDMRDKANHKKSAYISDALLAALKETFAGGRQSLLFINRRGSARIALCNGCGWTAKCPRCAIPLSLHATRGQLLCHWCGHSHGAPGSCPACGGHDIAYLGAGSQRIEQEVASFLPRARLGRLDSDSRNQRRPGDFLKRLEDGAIDILIGTQMIAKGLDIPSIETIGVISADSHLYIPDFSANERAFQLLYQVSGRAGRRPGVKNRTIIQTYSPEHPTIVAAAGRNYEHFMATELAERSAHHYPPYAYLLKLSVRRASRDSAQKAATKLAGQIRTAAKGLEVIGPAPAFRETLGGKYYWQIIIKSRRRQPLVELARNAPAGWSADLDPIDLL